VYIKQRQPILKRLQSKTAKDECDAEYAEPPLRKFVGIVFLNLGIDINLVLLEYCLQRDASEKVDKGKLRAHFRQRETEGKGMGTCPYVTTVFIF
jgi:hypothetical protein